SSLKRFLNAVHVLGVSFRSLPAGKRITKEQASEFMAAEDPDIIIAVETPGANDAHEYHNMGGNSISPYCADYDTVFRQAYRHEIYTVGIGDGGNELGLGALQNSIRDNVPYGKICRCPCKHGIAATTKAHVPLIAGTSNWAAYALALAIIDYNETLFVHSPAKESFFQDTAKNLGLVDGMLGYPSLSVDGVKYEDLIKKIMQLTATFPVHIS
ncbi:MAG: glutamate cyclase domain-containing protein, partial [Candidatus Ranarchaeia archaeon]